MTTEQILYALYKIYYLIDTHYPDIDDDIYDIVTDLNILLRRKREEESQKE